jgi:putative ABC transport system permease protein
VKFIDLLKLITENLNRRKGRVALTAVGVVIGTAAVVVLVSLAIGLQQNFARNLYGISDLTRIDVYPGYPTEASAGVKVSGPVSPANQPQMMLLNQDAIESISAIPGVVKVIPQEYSYSGGMLKYGSMEAYVNILGTGTNDLKDLGYEAIGGTTQLGKGTAVIGGWIPRNFYDPKQRPGQPTPEPPKLLDETLKLTLIKYGEDGTEIRKTIPIKVVGQLKETRGESDGSMYVTMEDMTAWNEWVRGSRINRKKEGYGQLIVRAENPEVVLDVTQQINDLGFQANTPQQYLQPINNFFMIMQLIFGGVGAIALLVAAIGIANTMTMAILERTREIGLMKAVGATNRDVLSIFLGEAGGIGFVGGVGGVILGWLAGQVINIVAVTYLTQQVSQTGGPPPNFAISTPAWLPIFALAFATMVGLLSGLYPALRAATLVPVTALKYE